MELFISVYAKKEALLSNQIERTPNAVEADLTPSDSINDVQEELNFVKALNYGIENLETFPLSFKLIEEIHGILFAGISGVNKVPGEFRQAQNWITKNGNNINDAVFVPPPPEMVIPLMCNLEKFMYDDTIPPLIKIALIHAQFENIHPFFDGNGRLGRLLITFFLLWKKILSKPVLYFTFYLIKNKTEYHKLLNEICTDGTWETFVKFFLKGISEVSQISSQKWFQWKQSL